MTEQKNNVMVIMAFSTDQELNQLTVPHRVALVNQLTDLTADGVTTTEHLGGYRMQDGTNAVEYSYTFDMFGLDQTTADKVRAFFESLKELHNQESILYNGNFI